MDTAILIAKLALALFGVVFSVTLIRACIEARNLDNFDRQKIIEERRCNKALWRVLKNMK